MRGCEGLNQCVAVRPSSKVSRLCSLWSQVHFHFSDPMEVKDEVHLRSAIYLAAVSMLMGWAMEPQVGCPHLHPPGTQWSHASMLVCMVQHI